MSTIMATYIGHPYCHSKLHLPSAQGKNQQRPLDICPSLRTADRYSLGVRSCLSQVAHSICVSLLRTEQKLEETALV